MDGRTEAAYEMWDGMGNLRLGGVDVFGARHVVETTAPFRGCSAHLTINDLGVEWTTRDA